MTDNDPTRQRLLDAAGPIFAEKGCQTASVRDITDRAGVNVSAVNYYFRSKEQLYLETVRPFIVGEDGARELTVDILADHITEFSLAAIAKLYPRRKHGART